MALKFESFIDEKFLKKLEKLKVITKKGIKGPEKGEHKSWKSGEGLEFLDYRKYQPGDDLRYVDWSVYGRLNKLLIKLFHVEESQTVHILMDMSKSMGTGDPSKHEVAKKITAAVSYICLSNLDKVCVTSFTDRILTMGAQIRGKRKYSNIINTLISSVPAEKTDFNSCLTEYAANSKNPGVILILSDLFDPKGYEEGLKALTYRKFDINLIHLLDKEELNPMDTGGLILEDVETGEKKTVSLNHSLVELYKTRINTFISDAQSFCADYGIKYYMYNTNISFENFLLDYLIKGAIFR